MKKRLILALLTISFILISFLIVIIRRLNNNKSQVFIKKTAINLPPPSFKSQTSVEEALLKRRSVREFKKHPVTLTEISQLLWAAQGITEKTKGFRAAPSAGALYPLEIYLVAGNVDGLQAGVYKYKPEDHKLIKIIDSDKRIELYNASFQQFSLRDAPATIVISAIYERTTAKYGERGKKYVHMEVGHASENVYLQATALDLGTVFIGAFNDEEVKKIINMQKNEEPLSLMPVGKK